MEDKLETEKGADPRKDLMEAHQGGVRKNGHKSNGGRDDKPEDGGRQDRRQDGGSAEEKPPSEPKHGETEGDPD